MKCKMCGNKGIFIGKYIEGDHVCREYECSVCPNEWLEVD